MVYCSFPNQDESRGLCTRLRRASYQKWRGNTKCYLWLRVEDVGAGAPALRLRETVARRVEVPRVAPDDAHSSDPLVTDPLARNHERTPETTQACRSNRWRVTASA